MNRLLFIICLSVLAPLQMHGSESPEEMETRFNEANAKPGSIGWLKERLSLYVVSINSNEKMEISAAAKIQDGVSFFNGVVSGFYEGLHLGNPINELGSSEVRNSNTMIFEFLTFLNKRKSDILDYTPAYFAIVAFLVGSNPESTLGEVALTEGRLVMAAIESNPSEHKVPTATQERIIDDYFKAIIVLKGDELKKRQKSSEKEIGEFKEKE